MRVVGEKVVIFASGTLEIDGSIKIGIGSFYLKRKAAIIPMFFCPQKFFFRSLLKLRKILLWI